MAAAVSSSAPSKASCVACHHRPDSVLRHAEGGRTLRRVHRRDSSARTRPNVQPTPSSPPRSRQSLYRLRYIRKGLRHRLRHLPVFVVDQTENGERGEFIQRLACWVAPLGVRELLYQMRTRPQ